MPFQRERNLPSCHCCAKKARMIIKPIEPAARPIVRHFPVEYLAAYCFHGATFGGINSIRPRSSESVRAARLTGTETGVFGGNARAKSPCEYSFATSTL